MAVDPEIADMLEGGLRGRQFEAVSSSYRRVLVVAGAGSGKTEVMARRIAWWVADGVPKDGIIALSFTEKSAAELKFRVREWIGRITPGSDASNLGGMFVGTIHGYSLTQLRERWPDEYHNYDVLDDVARSALIYRGFCGVLGLGTLRDCLNVSQIETIRRFTQAYDQLHEHNKFEVDLPDAPPPTRLGQAEREWCIQARLKTEVGQTPDARAFAVSAARYYAYLRCRRFLDFSTSQTEFLSRLRRDAGHTQGVSTESHVVVDEVQDINPVQRSIIDSAVGARGSLTAVGDHRQAIYGFRGAKVEIIGDLWKEFSEDDDSVVIDLEHNFRSTPRIVNVANRWASTIGSVGGMETPDMAHGKDDRRDAHPSHVAMVGFRDWEDEARWIAEAIRALVPTEKHGAQHDTRSGGVRGIALSDVAVLVRSSTNVHTYMDALTRAGIPCIVRAGPDLYSQPEVLLFLGLLGVAAGVDVFLGSNNNPRSLPNRVRTVLGCPPTPVDVVRAAGNQLRTEGVPFARDAEDRAIAASSALCRRVSGENAIDASLFRSAELKTFLRRTTQVRRVFPQSIFHWLLEEAEIDKWDTGRPRHESAMFHLGTLSGLITGIETPGWTSATEFKWQIVGLYQYGAEGARDPEQPLIVSPDAVTISTIHGAKGLEFPAVFLADVRAGRFPSNYARRVPDLPLAGPIREEIGVVDLADNQNYDGERRLMYVAITRAERFLVVSHSGQRTSRFIKELSPLVREAGGTVGSEPEELLREIQHAPLEYKRDVQLSTSFSDLRYYLGCPHDFYLRKVLGFQPTINQAFGFGRGVHNLLRAVHTEPDKWAALATDPDRLRAALSRLVDDGLFYLRYTTGDPADNMRRKGIEVVADYVRRFSRELSRLTFDPEREFETLVEYEDRQGGALVSGVVDLVRMDDPPKVTIIDFKSGSPEDERQGLDEDEMRLQVGIYAVAAKREMEFAPERGLVRYLDPPAGGAAELDVPLREEDVRRAEQVVVETATAIRDRRFREGPSKPRQGTNTRCRSCDRLSFCGMPQALAAKAQQDKPEVSA